MNVAILYDEYKLNDTNLNYIRYVSQKYDYIINIQVQFYTKIFKNEKFTRRSIKFIGYE